MIDKDSEIRKERREKKERKRGEERRQKGRGRGRSGRLTGKTPEAAVSGVNGGSGVSI